MNHPEGKGRADFRPASYKYWLTALLSVQLLLFGLPFGWLISAGNRKGGEAAGLFAALLVLPVLYCVLAFVVGLSVVWNRNSPRPGISSIVAAFLPTLVVAAAAGYFYLRFHR